MEARRIEERLGTVGCAGQCVAAVLGESYSSSRLEHIIGLGNKVGKDFLGLQNHSRW